MSLILRHKTFFFIVALTTCFLALPLQVFADSSLKVYVGYTGGPYYLKTTINESGVKSLSDGKTYEYSTFDSGGFLVKGAGKGPTVKSIFDYAGIDASNLKRFYFATSDGYVNDDGGEGNSAWYYSALTETRYYYPKLGQYWDFQEKALTPKEDVDIDSVMSDTAVATKSILAYESAFFRPKDAAEFASIPNLKQYEGLRLMVGQLSYKKSNAFYFAQSVKSITCIFGKTPSIDLEVNGQSGGSFTADVGDVIKVKANIDADDPEISKWGVYDIRWSISDSSIADFVRDENGNIIINDDGTVSIVVYGKGNIDIGADYGNSPYSEYVSHGSASGTGTGEGSGDGSGKGNNSGDGEGSSVGNGTANLDGEEGTCVSFESNAAVVEDSNAGGGGGGGTQAMAAAFKLNVSDSKAEQELNENIQATMLDFNSYAPPLLFLLFACLTFGIVWRVKKTENDKDPFMQMNNFDHNKENNR